MLLSQLINRAYFLTKRLLFSAYRFRCMKR